MKREKVKAVTIKPAILRGVAIVSPTNGYVDSVTAGEQDQSMLRFSARVSGFHLVKVLIVDPRHYTVTRKAAKKGRKVVRIHPDKPASITGGRCYSYKYRDDVFRVFNRGRVTFYAPESPAGSSWSYTEAECKASPDMHPRITAKKARAIRAKWKVAKHAK